MCHGHARAWDSLATFLLCSKRPLISSLCCLASRSQALIMASESTHTITNSLPTDCHTGTTTNRTRHADCPHASVASWREHYACAYVHMQSRAWTTWCIQRFGIGGRHTGVLTRILPIALANKTLSFGPAI